MSEPGWYPDPDDAARARYWDGSSWTDRSQPRPRREPSSSGGDASSGGPPAAGGSDASGGSWWRRPPVLAGLAAVVVVALVAGAFFVVFGGDAEAGEVILEPADDDGEDPFFASVATSTVAVESGGVEEVGGLADGVESLDGATPGLYGGTGDDAVCDQAALVEFLEGDADKADAFAEVLGIASEEIADYVASLTPVLLREDTRVTNHGFADGRAMSRQAVFEAGTAVLVDDLGVPRARCACGNPLTEPEATSGTPAFSGTAWSGFDETRLVAVSAAGEAQSSFELVDVATGAPYTVPVTSGDGMTVEALLNVTLPGWGCDGEDAQLVDGAYECAYGDVGSASPGSEPILRLTVRGVEPPWCDDPGTGSIIGCGTDREAAPILGDLTGDGRDEGVIIVGTGDSGAAAGFLNDLVFVFSADGELLRWPPASEGDVGDRGWVPGLDDCCAQSVTDVTIVDGVLEITAPGPRECRACVPGPDQTARFLWDGTALVAAP